MCQVGYYLLWPTLFAPHECISTVVRGGNVTIHFGLTTHKHTSPATLADPELLLLVL